MPLGENGDHSVTDSAGFPFKRFYESTMLRIFPRGTPRGKIQTIAQRPIGEALKRFMPHRTVLFVCDSFDPSIPQPVKTTDTMEVFGWALSSPPFKRIRIYVDDTFVGFANHHIFRPDVRAAYPQYPDSELSGFRKLIILDAFQKGLHRLKIVAEDDVYAPTSVEGMVEVEESHYLHTPHFADESVQPPLNARISVIILTKEPPADFEQTLERLRSQIGILQPEIVIINSGNSDLSNLAKYNVTSYTIQPDQFSHSATRNYAARMAKGDYVLFLSDDAIPAKNDLLLNMVHILANDRTVAAVTARQLPRSDSDLVSCFAIWEYYRALLTDRDKIFGSVNLEKVPAEQRRASCQIDDVCSCFNRRIFLKYEFSDAVSYAEDLELGIRLIKGGFKIARLFSTGVTHSHHRTTPYYLKRSYVDFKALFTLLGYKPPDFGAWTPKSLDDCIDPILQLHRSLSTSVESLMESAYCGYDIDKSFSMLFSRLCDGSWTDNASFVDADADLQNILNQITQVINYRPTTNPRSESNPLTSKYLMTLATFREWLIASHETLRDLESEFVEGLYKLLAVQIGGFLGEYFTYASGTVHDDKVLALDKFLSEGV